MMAMLVEHGYTVAAVASILDCSVKQVRRACANWREASEDLDVEPERVVH